MHEMALAESVLRIVERSLAGEADARLATIRLEIGALSHVEPAALRFCFGAVARGTVAGAARLEIVEVPASGACPDCGHEGAVTGFGAPCPRCGGQRLRITGGEEMRVRELEVV